MKIKITTKNESAINEALAEVNGKAASFTIRHLDDLVDIAKQGDRWLDKLALPKALRAGARLSYLPAGPSANSYGNRAISTRVEITANAKGEWFLTKVRRDFVHPKQSERSSLHISAAQKAESIKRLFAGVFTPDPADEAPVEHA